MAQHIAFWRQAASAARRSGRTLRTLIERGFPFFVRSGNRSCLRGEEGSELVELAVSLPILFGFVLGLMQICLAFYTHEYISELAREGTRYAIVHGPSCETSAGASCAVTASAVNAYVSGLGWPNLGGGTLTVSTTYPGPGGDVVGQPVQVTVTYTFPYKIPFVTSQNLSMSSKSVMYIIQ